MTLQILGLIYDAVGVMILGWTATMRKPRQIAAQGGTHWNENKPLIAALTKDTVDTATASVLLLIGFLIQIAGAAELNTAPAIVKGGYVVLGLWLIVYYLALRKKWINGLKKRILEVIAEKR